MNRLKVGRTRSGKSTAELVDMMAAAEARKQAIIVLDKHGSLTRDFYSLLISRRMQDRVLYERLSNTHRVLPFRFLMPSDSPDPLKRQAENDERITAFADVMNRQQGGTPLNQQFLKQEWTLAALNLWLHQRTPLTLDWLPFTFQHRHPKFKHMVENCTLEELQWKFADLERYRSPQALRQEIGAAQRLIGAVFRSPSFTTRCNAEEDVLDEIIEKRCILLIDASSDGSLSDDAARTMMGGIALRVIQKLKTNWGRTGRPQRVLLVLEEANNAGLVGPYEVKALAECQKMGLDVDILVQSLDFPTPEITSSVLTNTQRHEWFAAGDARVADFGSQDLLGTLDAYKVHHTDETERLLHDGYEYEDTRSTNEQTDEHGSVTRKGISHGKTARARFRKIVDVRTSYQSLHDQIIELKAKILGLQTGYRFVREGSWVTREPEYVVPLRDPWSFPGLADKMVTKRLAEQWSRPPFITPRLETSTRVERAKPLADLAD